MVDDSLSLMFKFKYLFNDILIFSLLKKGGRKEVQERKRDMDPEVEAERDLPWRPHSLNV